MTLPLGLFLDANFAVIQSTAKDLRAAGVWSQGVKDERPRDVSGFAGAMITSRCAARRFLAGSE